MKATEKKEPKGNPELGFKLLNFRRKLGFAIGQKKITQDEFGEMFGGRSGRVIASYELGDSEAPASLLYLFWKCGNSIDAIFNDGPITETGRERALELYENSISASVKKMTEEEMDRAISTLEDKRNEEGNEKRTSKAASTGNSRTAKASDPPSRTTKKH